MFSYPGSLLLCSGCCSTRVDDRLEIMVARCAIFAAFGYLMHALRYMQFFWD